MNATETAPSIKRICLTCGALFAPVDSWVCPECERKSSHAKQTTIDQEGGA
jgi:predicted amidophosphoribosyltransferase